MEQKTRELTHKFQTLYQNSQNQSKHMHELVLLSSGILIEEKVIPIEEIAVHVLKTLSTSTSVLKQLAERARLMTDRIADATQTLKDIETSIKAIGLINKKTKYLSLNAMIEALKEKQGKEGTMAVANEVRELSNDTQAITTIIADQSQKMRSILDDAKKTLEDVASFDFSQSIDAEKFISKMIDGLVDNNKKMSKIMEFTTESAKEFADTASGLIKSMQYEDRTQQDIQNLIKEISAIHSFFHELDVTSKKVIEEKLGGTVEEKDLPPEMSLSIESSALLSTQEKENDITLF